MKVLQIAFFFLIVLSSHFSFCQVKKYDRFEEEFQSDKTYENPLYDVSEFDVKFISPSGREQVVRGFWDGGSTWRVRFMPDEIGTWQFSTSASDKNNTGLNGVKGSFNCIENDSPLNLFQKGNIIHTKGTYHLSYADGTPFFWTACTAWNGALKSTDEEWDYYLNHRVENNYNTIQLVTTQWRGGTKNSEGEVAFTGSGKISLNPEFFDRIDQKIEEANAKGLLVSPVVLWALPFGQGTEYSPGYYLPIREAVILAKYIVARYQGNHVLWTLGGDGKYYGDLEDRWKSIGSQVFGDGKHQGLVTLHPHGLSWIGDIYENQDWYDVITYQSSHSNSENTVNWINKGPIAKQWDNLRPMPLINTEPNYEEIFFRITAKDVRNASYWSVFAAPPSGITYGANGIWPWLREGEDIENHESAIGTHSWKQSLDFEGSKQIGYLNEFINQFDWWNFKPANDLLVDQPGDEKFDQFVSVVSNEEKSKILIYSPVKQPFKLFNINGNTYQLRWFNPIDNTYMEGNLSPKDPILEFENPLDQDMVLVLERKE
ncbi:apiosidase-like domain-containing protein [Algoriphagus machipongonensis]|uniref:DUF4038 domain-containing protein n=1 Tax=Algoriphagus machipongonensis TaxID=388413 RepID=A3HT52_9BACT|nr:DUF4038 domain-containing protein [Algoriphagus machipongonensis]EAZ83020.1 hypothetical protein ALPR1_12405 [Algoriphagus machipongonensis]